MELLYTVFMSLAIITLFIAAAFGLRIVLYQLRQSSLKKAEQTYGENDIGVSTEGVSPDEADPDAAAHNNAPEPDVLKSPHASKSSKPAAKKNFLDFFLKANEFGFSWGESRALHRLASSLDLAQPNSLLGSTIVLDKCLKLLMSKAHRKLYTDEPSQIDLVYKLMDYRMGLEKRRPRYSHGMETTRTIKPGQILKVLIPDVGVYLLKVLDVSRTTISLMYPDSRAPAGLAWKGRSIEVWFWRNDDAMYYFETQVINEPDKQTLGPIVQIRHADRLVRTQKRNNIRVRVGRDGEILPLPSLQDANEAYQAKQGYMCRILDVSESGMAIIAKGKLNAGFLAKIQFMVGNHSIVMCGEIKAVDPKPHYKVSVLHLEALPLSKSMRISVMAYVLGFLTEEQPVALEDSAEKKSEELESEKQELQNSSNLFANAQAIKQEESQQNKDELN